MPFTDPGKLLLIVGLVIAAVGGAILLVRRLGLGHLPGDATVSGGGFNLFIPIVTCIVVSVVLTVVINVLLRLR